MDSNSKRRMKWRQEEMERRRTDRARQRSEIMSQRRQAAQTMYMDRMAKRAEAGGASSGAVSAIRYGEGLGANQDRMQGYMTADAQRKAAMISAESPERVQALRSASDVYVADSRLTGEKYAADTNLSIADKGNQNALALQGMKDKSALRLAKMGDATRRYIAQQDFESAKQAAQQKQIDDQLQRQHETHIAEIEAGADSHKFDYSPLPLYEGAGDEAKLVGYKIFNPISKEWEAQYNEPQP